MKFLNTIEALSKSKNLHNGAISEFIKEILKNSTGTLGCKRCNAWIFEKNNSQLTSLFSYSSESNEFAVERPLVREALPKYFRFLERNEFVVSDNSQNESYNSELLDGYLKPNKIMSMIDVPLRSEGNMIGLICFEHVKDKHNWTGREQSFTQSVAQLLSLAFVTKEKKLYRDQLEKIILQKEILIAEINHRVKNNMAIILSLLNIQKNKVSDKFHKQLFNEISDKVFSIAAVQEQLHTSEDIDSVDLGQYIKKLTQNLHSSYGREKLVRINLNLDTVKLDVSRAIPCGLIVNEVLTNSFKYAFDEKNRLPNLTISLQKKKKEVTLTLVDNGKGFDPSIVKNGMGLELIEGLAEQIDGRISVSGSSGVEVSLSFSL